MQYHSLFVLVCVAGLVGDCLGATTTERVKFCGGWLSKALSVVCQSFNSPTWERNRFGMRRFKRDYGIADECCNAGCTWNDLKMYCADDISVNVLPNTEEATAAYMDDATAAPASEEHVIADRSVEAADDEPPALGFRALFGRSETRPRAVARSAPVVGTVSPLLAWGRSSHADRPSRDRLLYVNV